MITSKGLGNSPFFVPSNSIMLEKNSLLWYNVNIINNSLHFYFSKSELKSQTILTFNSFPTAKGGISMKFLIFLLKSFLNFAYKFYRRFYWFAIVAALPIFGLGVIFLPIACCCGLLPMSYLYFEILCILGIIVISKWFQYREINKK